MPPQSSGLLGEKFNGMSGIGKKCIYITSVVYRKFPTRHMAKTYHGKQPAAMSVLTLVLRANLDPRGTKASFNDNFARLLYETSRCTPIDVGIIIWQVVEFVVKSEESPALPFGLLVTKICSLAGVEWLENDELQKQMEYIGHTSMTRSQGQSSRSRNAITMETLSNRLDAMSARIDARMDEMSGQQAEILKMVTLLVKEIQHLSTR